MQTSGADGRSAEWVVPEHQAGVRLDRAVAERLAMARQRARRLLAAGFVRLNGRTVDQRAKGRTLHTGDRIEVAAAELKPVPRADLPLTVLQEGDGFIVVEKPVGMPVHPLTPGRSDTVLNAVLARWPQVEGVGEGELRSGVVHRLDVETSGCLAFALTQPRWQELRRAFREHRVRKRYAAIVAGRLEGGRTETMDLYVAQHRPARVRVAAVGQTVPPGRTPRACTLTWHTVRATDTATLLDVDLHTGHLHQIRVMLAHLGHPVLGDRLYGRPDAAPDAPDAPVVPAARLMLHATHLNCTPLHATSPPPFTL